MYMLNTLIRRNKFYSFILYFVKEKNFSVSEILDQFALKLCLSKKPFNFNQIKIKLQKKFLFCFFLLSYTRYKKDLYS